jgi:DNA-repair protein complementing XP-A cells
MEKPNPRASHWHDMMLFLRYQVEDYAFSDKKWGSAEGLDAEYVRREAEKKKRTEKKFKMKIMELKKKTRTEAYRKGLLTGATGGNFGDVVAGGKHEHEWGIPVENQNGDTVKACTSCGMEVEELVF